MADHCASIMRPGRCVCLHPASFELPVSDRLHRRPLCDCFEHAQNSTATMASMAMSERPMCHPWTTKAIVRPSFCLQRWPGQFCGRTREAQRSQPLCKGGISEQPAGRSRVCLGSPAHIYRNDAVINKIYLHLPLDKMTAISHTIFHGGTTEEGNCSYLLPRAAATGSKRHRYGPNTQSSRGWNHVIFGV